MLPWLKPRDIVHPKVMCPVSRYPLVIISDASNSCIYFFRKSFLTASLCTLLNVGKTVRNTSFLGNFHPAVRAAHEKIAQGAIPANSRTVVAASRTRLPRRWKGREENTCTSFLNARRMTCAALTNVYMEIKRIDAFSRLLSCLHWMPLRYTKNAAC